MFTTRRRMTITAGAAFLALGLTACSTDDAEEPTTPAVQEEPQDTETDTPAEPEEETATPDAPVDDVAETTEPVAAEDEDPGADSGDYTAAPWAHPVTEGGDLLTTVEVGDVVVEVFQVGVTQATKTGGFVDPEENEPIIDVGDDIVFVNYVVTNNGDPLDLGSLLVAVTPRYDDWPYMQGMDSITDFDLTEEMGVNRNALAPGEMPDPIIYTLGTGESFSVGDNFHHQPNSPITFSARYTPVDEEGDMLHDERVEAEGSATIN